MNEVLFVDRNGYPVFKGDYVESAYGSFCIATAKDAAKTVGGKERRIDPNLYNLTMFQIIRRLITSGLLTARLMLDAESVLVEDQLTYLESIVSAALTKIWHKIGVDFRLQRKDNVGVDGVYVFYDSETDIDVSAIPLEEYFQVFIDAFSAEKATPITVKTLVADDLFRLIKKYRIKETKDSEEG